MVAKKNNPNELTCTDYQPIETIKNSTMLDPEVAEDACCDSCIHYRKGQCEVYIN